MASIEQAGDEVRVHVRVQPKSSRNAILGELRNRIKVCLTAPPVDGQANEALQAFMAKHLGVAKRFVSLQSGHRSRDKTLAVAGMGLELVRARLLGRDSRGST